MARIANSLYGRFPRPNAARKGDGAPGSRPITTRDRDIRSQAVHRLQIGLFGLGGMLLMVGLANIVMERARQSEAATAVATPVATPSASAEPGSTNSAASDPLVDMGVAPELPVNKPSPSAKPDAMVLMPGNAGNAAPPSQANTARPAANTPGTVPPGKP